MVLPFSPNVIATVRKRIIALEHLATLGDGADSDSYNFASVPLGIAAPKRHIVSMFAVANSTPRTVSSVSIAGIPAVLRSSDSNSNNGMHLATTNSPLAFGTSGATAINFSGACTRCFLSQYRITGANSVPFDASSTLTVGPTDSSVSVTIDVPKGGVVVALAYLLQTGSGVTWTNAAQDVSATADTSVRGVSASNIGPFETAQSLTVTANPVRSLIVASFSPL